MSKKKIADDELVEISGGVDSHIDLDDREPRSSGGSGTLVPSSDPVGPVGGKNQESDDLM